MIKLIVTDVDGTIVDKDEILHDEMIAYVKRLREKQLAFTIATGRAAGLAADYVKQLGIDIPFIACNGGNIVEKGEVILKRTIPLKGLRKVLETADGMGMSLLYSIDGVEYAYKETDYVTDQQKKYNRYWNPSVFSEEEWENLELDKVIVMAAVRDGSIGIIEELCKELPPPFGYKRYADKSIDILNCKSTKEDGVRRLAKLLNLSMDEILFAGDDLNDIEVIKEAGVGVAVGNAQKAVKEAADYVAGENCYLGVMEAVDKYTGVDAWRYAMDNSLRRQSYNLPDFLQEQFEELKSRLALLFTKEELKGIKRVILTGCGDSYGAGLTLRYAIEELIALPVELVTAIDFGRYYSGWRITKDTLVIVNSISGNGVRIKEAMMKAEAKGAMTLAITKNKDSDIGTLANKVLVLPITPFERGPGNRNYFFLLLALLMLGIMVGEMRGVHDETKSKWYYEEIKKQGELLKIMLPTWEERLFRLAKEWKTMSGFDFVGSGMEYGSAWFGHAKILESTGAFAMHINSEEWFHMNNFVKAVDRCGTIFIASVMAPGFSRTREAVGYGNRLGRPALVITDGSEKDFQGDALFIQVPSSPFLPAMALSQYVPICMLAGYMGALLGERNCRGCLGKWSFAAGGSYIKNSEFIPYAEGSDAGKISNDAAN